jgi:hypothetical protein
MQGRALAASDVYAVGATALAALTGVEPETLPHKGLRVDVRGALQGRVSPGLVTTLERMLEPDPDLRAPSIGAALDGPADGGAVSVTPSRPPAAPAAVVATSSEDAAVKSIRNLLFALWGLGWILVPIICGKVLGQPVAIPIVMFGWLAANLILSWHKGAIIRAAMRQWKAEGARTGARRQRVDAGELRHQVRIHGAELRVDEGVAGTEVQGGEERAERRAR